MELQRTRRLEPPLGGARIAPQHPRRLRERPLEHVAQDEDAQVGAAQRMAADEIAQARPEEATGRDGVADLRCGLAIELADPEQRRDLAVREMARLLERREEALDDDVVG